MTQLSREAHILYNILTAKFYKEDSRVRKFHKKDHRAHSFQGGVMIEISGEYDYSNYLTELFYKGYIGYWWKKSNMYHICIFPQSILQHHDGTRFNYTNPKMEFTKGRSILDSNLENPIFIKRSNTILTGKL